MSPAPATQSCVPCASTHNSGLVTPAGSAIAQKVWKWKDEGRLSEMLWWAVQGSFILILGTDITVSPTPWFSILSCRNSS